MMNTFENQFKQQQTLIKPKVLFCTDLRTCGLIIGYLELLSGILSFVVFGILFSFLKLTIGGSLLCGIYSKKPSLLIPFLVEHSFTIVGAIVSLLILLLHPSGNESSANESYTTDITDEDDLFHSANKTLFTIAFIIAIAISTHSWFVIFTLYQQYIFLQLTPLRGTGPFVIATNPMHRNVAIIENGYQPTYGRNTIIGMQ